MGRPSLYDDSIVQAICHRLGEGEPMAEICRSEGMPAYRTVKDWMDEDSERGRNVAAAIARAREAGFDVIAAQCLKIAEDGSNDYMARLNAEGQETGVMFNAEHVQRSKLRIETRLKLLAKWDPKRYGEKVTQEVTGADGAPLVVTWQK